MHRDQDEKRYDGGLFHCLVKIPTKGMKTKKPGGENDIWASETDKKSSEMKWDTANPKYGYKNNLIPDSPFVT